jgi:hypothetical protein
MSGGQGMEPMEDISNGGVDLCFDVEQAMSLLSSPSPPWPAWEKTWTSMGRTSIDDPMRHYLYNGSG